MKNRIFDMLTGSREAAPQAPAAESSDDASQSVTERLQELGGLMTEHVRRQPAASLGIALACGIVVGWLMKRR